jgi:hypothetical protein
VEVIPHSHKNCTEEIPALSNKKEGFVDPISYVIKTARSPVHCNDIAPPGTRRGASGTAVSLSSESVMTLPMLPVDKVRIEGLRINDIMLR